ncbi:MAG TPA: hypothetical protein ENH13_01405 [Euryarchaeota archaeon]|nr:hypothetical protein BMS3Bbin16_00864 [archaeon BMS3Bbin16]HDH27770.1 hypothetical protein [Euryarchaeota archaeon]
MLFDTPDLLRYIAANYSGAEKIVEIGMGPEDSVYKALKREMDAEILAVDICPSGDALFDDIFEPDIEKYSGASLIYSIRPNPELILPLQKIAQTVGADLLIRPLTTDSGHKPPSMKLMNYGRAVLWVEKHH